MIQTLVQRVGTFQSAKSAAGKNHEMSPRRSPCNTGDSRELLSLVLQYLKSSSPASPSLSLGNLDYLVPALDAHVDKNMTKRIPSRIVLVDVSFDYEVPRALENIDM
jgi:hypothetical protein